MPGLDGYDIISALKKSKKTKDIPVVFITGLDSLEAEEKGLALGAADYIPKPFHPAIVRLRVLNQIKLIERSRQHALMAKISHNFLSDAHVDSLFTDTLRMVGEFLDVATVLLYKFESDSNTFICRNEWLNPRLNLETYINRETELKEPMFSVATGLLANNAFCLHSNDPAYSEVLKPYTGYFTSYIFAPVFIKGKMCALLEILREDDGREWSEGEIDLAVLISGVFSGVFERDSIEHDLNVVLKLKADLTSAMEHAEHLSRVKSEFLSRMSHEMRTPMNAIMGMLQVVKRRGVPPNIKEDVGRIETASRQLMRLIDDVLDMSGMAYGAFALSDSAFNFNEMIDDVLQGVSHNIREKQQTFNTGVDPAIPASLIGDESRLRQVIVSLLANAVKFTPEKGEIYFGAWILSEGNEFITLKIEIADNGIGLSKAQQKNLFELFEQVDGSYTRKHGGIRIGLALSRRIALMMGGDIRVESELNEGATFTFTCKLKKVKTK
jgi:signal transduction histidine kinase